MAVIGNIFNVQRCSLHDGPGIRTTAFLKGCPLRCIWCQNPEGISPDPTPAFDEKKCIGCKSCSGITDPAVAAEVCPTGARSVFGRACSSDELVKELVADADFYADGGGVTFSGGEALLQPDFVAECASAVKSAGISVAVDTCGCVPYGSIEKVIPCTDIFLYDIKSLNDEKHRLFTGRSNKTILENFERLAKTGVRIWVRIPVVGGFNADIGEMLGIKNYLENFASVEKVEPLRYHELGSYKYRLIGRPYLPDDSAKVSKELFGQIKQLFEK